MQQTILYVLIAAVVFFAAQLLFCFGAKRRRFRLVPVWVLLAFGLAVLVYWLLGLGSYQLGSIISLREAHCLFGCLLTLGAAAGDILAWLAWRSTGWRT